jgi:hypothetical protein
VTGGEAVPVDAATARQVDSDACDCRQGGRSACPPRTSRWREARLELIQPRLTSREITSTRSVAGEDLGDGTVGSDDATAMLQSAVFGTDGWKFHVAGF